jgi:MFS family permease
MHHVRAVKRDDFESCPEGLQLTQGLPAGPQLARVSPWRGIGGAAAFGAAALLVVPTWLTNPYLAVAAIALVAFCNDIQLPGAWTACMDVGGKAVATLSGTMNMMGNVGGFVSPIVCGYIVKHTGNWNLAFYVTACAYLLGALCWPGMDPVTPLEEQSKRT